MNRAEKRRQRKLAGKAQKTTARKERGVGQLGRQQAREIQHSLDLAVQHHHAGDLPKAEGIYRQVLQSDPNQPVALHLLGMISHQVGKDDIAEELIAKAIAIKPDFAEAHSNLGLVLKGLGRLDEAVAHFRNATAIKPDFAEAHYNLGNALKDLGRIDEAVAHFRKAISIKPDFARVHNNLGLALQDLGRIDDSITHYRKAIDIKPEFADPHSNLGNAIKDLGRIDEAIVLYRKAIDIKPDYAEAHHNLGIAQKELGNIVEAVARFRKAIGIKPDYAVARSNLLFAMHYDDFALEDVFNEHKLWNDHHADFPQALMFKNEKGADPEKKLRVGFVSEDFREHSVPYFLRSFFAARDSQRLVFYCYSNSYAHQEDEVTKQLRDMVDGWRIIAGQNDQVVSENIRADKIDILVDLSGHTKGHRLPVFARKPAPVQATWLGYPDTTGLLAMDYRITDHIADPPGLSDEYSVERLVRLANGFLCYDPPNDAPDVVPMPGEEKGHVTFVSFNNLSKITPAVVKTWAQILKAVHGAKLLIKNRSFGCPGARQRYQSLFENESIEPGRLTLLCRSPSTREHLAMYGQTDIALDSFPYNGTTTTCEALWMGVPVVVLRGDRHAARVGASLLYQAGLESLIAEDVDDYIEKAVSLANDMDRLKTLRKDMRTRIRKSSLCDSRRFAENMETAFRDMWSEWCNHGTDQISIPSSLP